MATKKKTTSMFVDQNGNASTKYSSKAVTEEEKVDDGDNELSRSYAIYEKPKQFPEWMLNRLKESLDI